MEVKVGRAYFSITLIQTTQQHQMLVEGQLENSKDKDCLMIFRKT